MRNVFFTITHQFLPRPRARLVNSKHKIEFGPAASKIQSASTARFKKATGFANIVAMWCLALRARINAFAAETCTGIENDDEMFIVISELMRIHFPRDG